MGQKIFLRNIIKALKNRSACLIANHGQVAFGGNLEKTFELAQEIENICHQYINALRIGIPKILSKKEMKIVLGKFKNYKKDSFLMIKVGEHITIDFLGVKKDYSRNFTKSYL